MFPFNWFLRMTHRIVLCTYSIWGGGGDGARVGGRGIGEKGGWGEGGLPQSAMIVGQ